MTWHTERPAGYAWLSTPDFTKWTTGGMHRGTLPADLRYRSWDRDLTAPGNPDIPTLAIDHWTALHPPTGETHTLPGAAAGATTLGGVGALSLPPGHWEFTAWADVAETVQVGTGSRSLTPAMTGLANIQAGGDPEFWAAYSPCTIRHRLTPTEGGGPAQWLADDDGPGAGWEDAFLGVQQPAAAHPLRARRSLASVIQSTDAANPAEAAAFAALLATMPSSVTRFDVGNERGTEPNRLSGVGPHGAALVPWALATRDVVEAARGVGHTHGPNYTSFQGTKWGWVEDYANGGGFQRIKPAMHFYNLDQTRLGMGTQLARLQGLLRRTSNDGAGGYYTVDDLVWGEAGGATAAFVGNGSPWEQARHFMLSLMTGEQYGMLAGNVAPYYGLYRGHPSHFSWTVEANGNPYPLATALAWLCNVILCAGRPEDAGATGRRGHDFGGLNPWVAASTYRQPDGSAWTWLQTDGIEQYAATFRVLGAAPGATFPLHNYAGRQIDTLTPASGLLAVPITMLPQYLRSPAGVTLETVEPRRIDRSAGCTAAMSSAIRYVPGENHTPASAADPLIRFADARSANDARNLVDSLGYPMTVDPVTPGTPQWWRGVWSVPVTVDEALFMSPYTFDECVPMFAAGLQYLPVGANPNNDSAWVPLTDENGDPVAMSYTPSVRVQEASGKGALYTSWFTTDEPMPFVLYGRWAPRQMQGIRYVGTRAGRGWPPTQAAADAGGADGTGPGVPTPGLGLMRVMLWERGTTVTPSGDTVSGYVLAGPVV